MELHYEISNFLFREAMLLDKREFEKWLELMADDVTYRMPVRVTKELRDGDDIVDDMAFFEESKKSLQTRVSRFGTNSAWVIDPPPRTRHIISNIFIDEIESSDKVKTRSSFIFLRHRGSDLTTEQISGERIDVLRKEAGSWKIVERTIYPDQSVIHMMNLSMFL